MKKMILIFLMLPFFASGQDFEIFGYFEPQYNGVAMNDEFYQYQTNKLRIDLEAYYSDNVKFVANYDYITNHGKVEWSIFDFLPDKFEREIFDFADSLAENLPEEYQSQVPVMLSQATMFRYEDRNFLDNANVRLTFPKLDLTIGKQQISLGTGYAYNPVDVFNYKSLTDPTYEQSGHNAIRLDLPFYNGYGIMALYSPEDDWKNSTKLLQLKGRFSHFDFSFYGIETEESKVDYQGMIYSIADPVTFHAPQIEEERQMIGLDIVGELLIFGIWGEGGYNLMENSPDYAEFVVGGDYTFDNQFYIMGEYYQNDSYKDDPQDYTLNDWLWYINGEAKGLAQKQAFLYFSYPITDLITLQNFVIYGVTDKSTAVVPSINYSIFENVELDFITSIYLGEEDAAFSKKLGSGGILRARVYF